VSGARWLLSHRPMDSACRHRGEPVPSWGSSLGEGQPRLVAHTSTWYACHATLWVPILAVIVPQG
jgi:hypothetical protein